jgi:hypothetical protein
MKKLSILGASAATALLCAVPVSLQLSGSTVSVSLDKASARVGNPLSAGSIAGVNRRAARRTARGAYTGGYGYGIGTGVGVAAAGVAANRAYDANQFGYGTGYGAGYGYPGYGVAAAGVERRMARRVARRAYYGDQLGSGYGWGLGSGAAAAGVVGTSAAAAAAYGTWGAGMYTANADYYPTRTIYARDYRTPMYYGPVCSPRLDLGCQ